MALLVGNRLGAYEIVAPLGAGGMGEVYRARDPRLGRDVAIKVLPASVSTDPDRLRRFEQEARATGQLNHPNIVAVYDIGTNNGAPFIVYELLEGQSLRERLRGEAVPVRKAVDYAIQIARGLAVAHAQGIVHRDLKPENVFLTRDGRIKILDFGLAKLKRPIASPDDSRRQTEKQTQEGLILGTVGYMAPEQVRGQPADHRADIFSLGAILYEMVGGRRAFHADSDVETMNAILTREPSPLSLADSAIPPALVQVIEHSLEKEPTDRFQSVQDLAFDLELISSVSRTLPPSVDQRFPSVTKRRWAAIALGLVLAAVVGAAVTARMMRRTKAVGTSSVVVRRLTEFLGLENFPALSPDGRSVAFIASVDGRRQLWVRLVAGGPALQLTRDAADHLYPRWSRDSSSLIYFTPPIEGEEAGSIWEISALGGAPRRLASSLSGADLSPTDELAFFRLSSGKIELVAAKRDGSDIRVMVPELERGYLYDSPRWSPDGKSIAYERSYHGSPSDGIFAVSSGETAPSPLTLGGSMNGFAWLPDGSGIAFSTGRSSIMPYQETFQLWTTRLDEKQPTQLTFGEVSYVHPDMNRSGRIVATRIRLGSDLWRVPVDGDGVANVRAARPVTRQTAEVRVPSVSPSGREIVYLSDIGGHSNLWVRSIDMGESRQLTFETDAEVQIGLPLWSPDGRRIAFYWKGKEDFGYSTILPDGSGLRQVLTKGWWGCWSPDSRWLYYQDQQQPGRHLMKIPVDGGSPVVVRAENAAMPAISPDGATLYFIVEMPRASGGMDLEIRSASPENGPSRIVARIAAHRVPESGRFHPVISPDGRWLALPLVDGTTTNIWAVSTADGTMRRITDFDDRATFITRRVSWSPDGRFIYAAVSEGDADIVLFDGLRP